MKKILITLILVVLIFGGVVLYKTLNQTTDNTILGINTTDNIHIFSLEIVSTDNTVSTYQVPYTSGSTLATVLAKLSQDSDDFTIETDTSSMGEFVISINGIKANTETEFWSMQVNGIDSPVGISGYVPMPGDRITFTLTKFN
jgi:hypothetical protein